MYLERIWWGVPVCSGKVEAQVALKGQEANPQARDGYYVRSTGLWDNVETREMNNGTGYAGN